VATRLYLDSAAAAVSPAYDSGWEDTAQAAPRKTLARLADLNGIPAGLPYIINPSGTGGRDYMWVQMVSATINAQTIGGGGATFKGVYWCREDSASNDARAQIIVKVVSGDGSTFRGTALAMDTAALGSDEFASSYETRYFPRGGAATLSSVTAQAGDRLVVEIGFRAHSTGTGDTRLNGTDSTPDAAFTEALTGTGNRAWFEFSQTITAYTVDAAAENAAGTGAASNATISNVAPVRSFWVESAGDLGDKIRWDSFQFTEAAEQGAVGMGGFSVDDSAASLDVPALKPMRFTEYAQMSEPRTFTGFTQERTMQRGPNLVAGQREFDVEVVDINVLLDDYVMTGAGANRSAETDYARVTWLLTTALNTVGNVTAGVVPNSNTVDMDAVDYRGRKARDVLAECAEAAGKNYFLYQHTSSGPLLFYDLHTSSSLASSARISDVGTDVDSATTWAAIGPPKVKKSPDRVYSTVHLKYKGGTKIVSSATTLAAFRRRDIALTDLSVKTSAKALAKANRYLDGPASSENITVSEISVAVPAANVNDIRAGHRIEIKLTRYGISAFTWYRILRRTVSALNDVSYRITLQLADTVLPSIFVNGRGGEEIWEEKSNATEDDATVIVDGGGITITNGALTVTNGDDIVIIDGQSNMFKIAATGTISITGPAANAATTQTATVATGLTYPPAHTGLLESAAGQSWMVPYSVHDNTAGAGSGHTTDNHYQYAEVVSSNQTKVSVSWHSRLDRSATTLTARYFILKEQAF
jgi:hypothetical protein